MLQEVGAGALLLADLLCWAFADQEERTKAIEAFRDGKKDVLVATDVASKGLDFPAIQHVINYDMPEEIENYGEERALWEGVSRGACPGACGGRGWLSGGVSPSLTPFCFSAVHRIGRTGRSGNTGIATTFINKACGEKGRGWGSWGGLQPHAAAQSYPCFGEGNAPIAGMSNGRGNWGLAPHPRGSVGSGSCWGCV